MIKHAILRYSLILAIVTASIPLVLGQALDASFDAGIVGSTTFKNVKAMAVQADGKILVGGSFDSFNGQSYEGLVRILPDGTIDTTFQLTVTLGSAANVSDFEIQPDNKILVGLNRTVYFNTIAHYGVIRINTDGSIDTTFNVGLNAGTRTLSIALQTDGKVISVGSSSAGGNKRTIRLNTDGSVDSTFNFGTGADFDVRVVELQSDGKLIIGGSFSIYNGTSITRFARINTDGSLDLTFNVGTGVNNNIFDIEIQSDGKILIGGDFSTYSGGGAYKVARIDTNGALDTLFNYGGIGTTNTVTAVAIQPDGKILVGGNFNSYNGISRIRLLRLNADGTLDETFDPGLGADKFVQKIVLQSDNKIVLGGSFTQYNGTLRDRIARIFPSTIVTDTVLGLNFCARDTVYASFIIDSLVTIDSGNVFTAQLSDSSGSFNTFTNIGSIAGLTSDTIICILPDSAVYGTGYRIRVVASSPQLTGGSNSIDLTIDPIPIIVQQPMDNSYCSFTNLELYVGVLSSNFTFQWQVDTGGGFSNLANGGFYSGVTDDTLMIDSPVSALSLYQYRCIVSGTCGSPDTSAAATILSSASGPAINRMFLDAPAFDVGYRPEGIISGDFNNDGAIDIAVANKDDSTISVLFNCGAGYFTSRTDYFIGAKPYSIITEDFNGDSFLDLAVVCFNNSNVYIYLGSANGVFTPGQITNTGGTPYQIAKGDFNNDTIIDLAVTNKFNDQITVIYGVGNGTFSGSANFAVSPRPERLTVADLNGDGWPDIATGCVQNDVVSILIGDSIGNFTLLGTLPVGQDPGGIVSADLNYDGMMDLVVANVYEDSISILLGLGAGVFAPQVKMYSGNIAFFIDLGDVNNDGLVDIVVCNEGANNVSIFTNNGGGVFTGDQYFHTWSRPRGVVVDDFNGDGNADIVTCNRMSSNASYLEGDGTGYFLSHRAYKANNIPRALVAEDFNSDSIPDIAVINVGPLETWSGQGTGDLTYDGSITNGFGGTDILTEDFDGDGFADLALGNFYVGEMTIFSGDGTGSFQNTASYLVGYNIQTVGSGDFNEDGFVDLAAGTFTGQFMVLLNDGFGAFTTLSIDTISASVFDIKFADFNSDGHLDLLYGDIMGDSTYILLGDGNGAFAHHESWAINNAHFTAIGDFNEDDIADVVVAGNYAMTVSIGNGDGTFTIDTVFALNAQFSQGVVVADLDGDCHEDIALNYGNIEGWLGLFMGNGNGEFTFPEKYSIGCDPKEIIAHDLNGDNKLDLVTTNVCSDNISVLINQVVFSSIPEPTVPSSSIAFSNISTGSIAVQFNVGDGARRIVVARPDSTVDWLPADSIKYQEGMDLGGGNIVVYDGVNDSVNMLNLLPCTDYYFAVFEYSNCIYPNYLISSYATGMQATSEAFSISYISDTVLCAGSDLVVVFDVFSNPDTGNVFSLQLSDTSGSFVNAQTIGSVSGIASDTIFASISDTLVDYLYKLRVIASDLELAQCLDSFTVQVIAVPQTPFVTANVTTDICDGDTVTLIANSGYTSTQWNDLNSTLNDTLMVYSSGTYTATVTDSTGMCSVDDSLAVSFNPLPIVNISGTAEICDGNSTLLTATGGITYAWSSGNTTASISVSPTTNTNYAVTVTDGNTCNASDSIGITVNPNYSTSTSDVTICSGDSVVIFGVYQSVAGTYYDSSLSSAGCDSITITALTIDALPTVNFTGLDTGYCSGDIDFTDTLIGTPSGGTFSGPGLLGNVYYPFVSGLGTFTITYGYTDGNGCTDTLSKDVNITTCTAIEQLDLFYNLQIYPNPNTGIFTVVIDVPHLDNVVLKIINNRGQDVFTEQLKDFRGSHNFEVNLKAYAAGVYNLQLVTGSGIINRTVIVE